MYIPRALEKDFRDAVDKQKSILLLGPRQTGKTTLLERLPAKRRINLADPDSRLCGLKKSSKIDYGTIGAGSSIVH
jgi:predicted AAA+ superfamily ATPase